MGAPKEYLAAESKSIKSTVFIERNKRELLTRFKTLYILLKIIINIIILKSKY